MMGRRTLQAIASVFAAVAYLIMAMPAAHAIDTAPPLPDPQLQARYLELTHDLRCMQCQNESIADSPVSLAADLRREVRESLLAGQSDQQILDRMVARYGDFILFRPRMNARNAWLWAAPGVLLLVGLAVGARVISQRRRLMDSDEAVDQELNEL
jgi:cytochrome c-type biogenesis protein CcmH